MSYRIGTELQSSARRTTAAEAALLWERHPQAKVWQRVGGPNSAPLYRLVFEPTPTSTLVECRIALGLTPVSQCEVRPSVDLRVALREASDLLGDWPAAAAWRQKWKSLLEPQR